MHFCTQRLYFALCMQSLHVPKQSSYTHPPFAASIWLFCLYLAYFVLIFLIFAAVSHPLETYHNCFSDHLWPFFNPWVCLQCLPVPAHHAKCIINNIVFALKIGCLFAVPSSNNRTSLFSFQIQWESSNCH